MYNHEETVDHKIIRRSVAFEQVDLDMVKSVAERHGLGNRGFSAALRMIIRRYRSTDERLAEINASVDAGLERIKDVQSIE